MFEASPTGINLYRLEPGDRLVMIDANPAAQSIIGVDSAQLIGKTLEEAYPNLVETDFPDMYRAVARGDLDTRTVEIPYGDERFSGYFSVTVFRTSPERSRSCSRTSPSASAQRDELQARTEDLHPLQR